MLEELFTQLYHKLKSEKENDKKSKNGYFEFFVNVILKNDAHKVKRVIISDKALKNCYEKYVEKKENKSGEPKNELKNFIAHYLGFQDYNDFVSSNKKIEVKAIKKQQPNETLTYEKQKNKTFIERYKKGISISILVLLSLFLMNKYWIRNTQNCILWQGNHFQDSNCSVKNSLDNSIYNINIQNFKEIEVTTETQFFKNGKPIIWYGKSKSRKIEFFTARGIHPETLKELKPITEYIINKHILIEKDDKTIID